MELREQAVEGGEPGLAREDAVELRLQRSLDLRGGSATPNLEIGVELPDQIADGRLSGAVLVGEGIELVNQLVALWSAVSSTVNDLATPAITNYFTHVSTQFPADYILGFLPADEPPVNLLDAGV
jgi:hypothetical protein